MDHIRNSAYETVLRNCGFTTVGIVFVMTAISYDPRLALEVGGFLTILMAFVLILKSERAVSADEPGISISASNDSHEAELRSASAAVLRDTYLTFAKWTSFVSAILWTLAAIVSLFGLTAMFASDEVETQSLPTAERAVVATPLTAAEWRRMSIRYQFML
jgi:hypothetical protein